MVRLDGHAANDGNLCRTVRHTGHTRTLYEHCRERICPFRLPNYRNIPDYTNRILIYLYPGLVDAARRPTGTPAGDSREKEGGLCPTHNT